MPRVAIKAALQALLQNAYVTACGGDGRIAHVDTQYPRLSDQVGVADFPRVVIWEAGYQEQQLAGGSVVAPIGVKEAVWTFTIHAATLLDDPLTEGAAWDQLLDDMEATLRAKPTLSGATEPSGMRVMSAQKMRGRTLPPQRDQMRNAYNSYIDVTIREAINA